jgi:hypothetical protein
MRPQILNTRPTAPVERRRKLDIWRGSLTTLGSELGMAIQSHEMGNKGAGRGGQMHVCLGAMRIFSVSSAQHILWLNYRYASCSSLFRLLHHRTPSHQSSSPQTFGFDLSVAQWYDIKWHAETAF